MNVKGQRAGDPSVNCIEMTRRKLVQAYTQKNEESGAKARVAGVRTQTSGTHTNTYIHIYIYTIPDTGKLMRKLIARAAALAASVPEVAAAAAAADAPRV